MVIPQKTVRNSLILKGIVILSAVIGTVLSALSASAFMGGSTVFKYFTIQSNLALALVSLIGAVILLKKAEAPRMWFVIRLVAAVSITLTGVVFCFVLAPTLERDAWSLSNILTHVVVPVVSVIDYYVSCAYGELRKADAFYVVIPPLAYAVYSGIGYVNNWDFGGGRNYPYFFLDWGSPAGAFGFTNELPFLGCAWWIMLLLGFLILVGLIYVSTLNRFRKKNSGIR